MRTWSPHGEKKKRNHLEEPATHFEVGICLEIEDFGVSGRRRHLFWDLYHRAHVIAAQVARAVHIALPIDAARKRPIFEQDRFVG